MNKFRESMILAAMAAFALIKPDPVRAAEEPPIVIGMTFAQRMAQGREFQARAGVMSYLGRINAAGGIHGRKIELQTLDDEGKPERIAENLRTLVKEHKAVAIIGCLSDAACQTTAEVANELKVPVIGVTSGLPSLSRKKYPYMFRLRAESTREVEAIAKQMVQMGQSRVAVLSDGSSAPELDALLQQALSRQKIAFDLIKVPSAEGAPLADIVRKLGSSYHAAVLNISSLTVEAFIDQNLSERPEWPRMLMTLATGNLAPMIRHFKGRAVGFSMVMPNPELLKSAIARELNQDADQYGSGWAISFDGMEAYLSARLLVQAMKQAGRNITPQQIYGALDSTPAWDLSGFRVSFANGRSSGSDWVEMGLRSGTGLLVH